MVGAHLNFQLPFIRQLMQTILKLQTKMPYPIHQIWPMNLQARLCKNIWVDALNGNEITSVLTQFVDNDENSAFTVFIGGQIKEVKDDLRNKIKTELNKINDPLVSTGTKPEEIYQDLICSQKVKFSQVDSDRLIPNDSLKEID